MKKKTYVIECVCCWNKFQTSDQFRHICPKCSLQIAMQEKEMQEKKQRQQKYQN